MSTLESRDFVATSADIEDITRRRLSASIQASQSQDTYLKALTATTIVELGEKPRTRNTAKADALSPDEIRAHLVALENVHQRFYAIVLKAILEGPEELGRKRKTMAHRKATFARTSKTLLRAWIKAGHDIRALAAARVTKPMLIREIPDAPKPVAATMRRRALGLGDRLISLVGSAPKADKPAAVEALESVMQLLAYQMTEMGATIATRPEAAIRDGRPFKRGSTVYWPIAPGQPAANDDTESRKAAH